MHETHQPTVLDNQGANDLSEVATQWLGSDSKPRPFGLMAWTVTTTPLCPPPEYYALQFCLWSAKKLQIHLLKSLKCAQKWRSKLSLTVGSARQRSRIFSNSTDIRNIQTYNEPAAKEKANLQENENVHRLRGCGIRVLQPEAISGSRSWKHFSWDSVETRSSPMPTQKKSSWSQNLHVPNPQTPRDRHRSYLLSTFTRTTHNTCQQYSKEKVKKPWSHSILSVTIFPS